MAYSQEVMDAARELLGLGPDAPITDASEALDYLVEDVVRKFQDATKALTDKLVELSAARVKVEAQMTKQHEAITMAYAAIMDKRYDDARHILGRVFD